MRWILFTLGMTTLTGCFGPDGNGGQFGTEEGAHCEVDTSTVLGLSDQSPLGFTAQSVLDYAVITDDDVLEYGDGTTTPLHLTVTYGTGEVRYVEEIMVDDGDSGGIEPDIALDCPFYVEIEVTIALATDDGAFAESWQTVLRSL